MVKQAPGALFVPDRRSRRSRLPPGFAPHQGNLVTPLLLAFEMYPALERMALAAETRLFLAFRNFDPLTATRSEEARALGLTSWLDILRHMVERGVVVRLLLTDFEPTMADALHGESWASFQLLRQMAEGLSKEALEGLEIIVAQHPGEVGWAVRQLLRLPVGLSVRRLLAGMEEDAEARLAVRPGLWRYHRLVDGQPLFRRGPAFRLWPATHHHKFAVADDRIAIIGGIDVNERRWETPDYAQPAPESWHDVSVQVEGPAAGDAAEHFRRLWNQELPRYREIVSHWMTGAERELAVEPLDMMPEPIPPAPAVEGGRVVAQVVRTLSRRSSRLLALGPVKDVRELMHAHRRLILSAEKLLYIEAQFFRSRRAAGWIVEAARRNPALRVIVLLPQAPDDVAFNGAGRNPAHQHGEWLQARALGRLLRKLGDRVGLYSMGRRVGMTAEEKALVADRGAAFGAGMIYVHSKLLMVDDRAALVSSCNINGRSFGWDSELGLLFEDKATVREMRERLWGQILGEVPSLAEAARLWAELAAANVAVAPEERRGFVLPYRFARVRRFGRPSWFVPDDLV